MKNWEPFVPVLEFGCGQYKALCASRHLLCVKGQERRRGRKKKKLTRTSISHGQQEGAVVLPLKVLVVKLLAVDGLAAGAIADGEVTALDHELLDDAVELGALVVEGLAGLAQALLAGAQGAEVLGRLGHDVVVQLHDDPAGLLGADLDVEEDAAAGRLGVLGCGHGLGCGGMW